jgi:hypothetical protein
MVPPLEIPKTFQNKFFWKDLIDPSIIATTNNELDVVVIAQVEANLPNSHKRKKMYELNCRFQNSWAIRLS